MRRRLRPSKPSERLFRSNKRTHVSVLALSFAVGWTLIAAPDAARAQQRFTVDITDPNVQVDLSVLDDGGRSSNLGLPGPATASQQGAPVSRSGGQRPPGPEAPVSTLYIQPSGTFSLPPQTKPLIKMPTPAVAQTPLDADMMDEADDLAPMPSTASTAEAVVSPPPAVKVPEPPAVAPTPEPAQDVVQEVAKAEPVPAPSPAPAAQAEPQPEPEPEPEARPEPQAKPVAETQAEPEPAPSAETVEQAAPPPPPAPQADQTPPPTALNSATAQQDAPSDAPTGAPEQDTSAEAAPAQPQPSAQPSNRVVVDLPPREDTAADRPGVANLPPGTDGLDDGDGMRIVFDHDSSKLPPDARDALSSLAQRLNAQESLRLQLLAYAGDADTSASAARRLSLSRALAVRSYLIESGVRSTRIDVRALGNKSTDDVTERVDISVMER